MSVWHHHIPISEFFAHNSDFVPEGELRGINHRVHTRLIDHRVFLRYIELPEDEIDEFTDIADDFDYTNTRRTPQVDDFDEALNRLYDWGDKNRIAIT